MRQRTKLTVAISITLLANVALVLAGVKPLLSDGSYRTFILIWAATFVSTIFTGMIIADTGQPEILDMDHEKPM